MDVNEKLKLLGKFTKKMGGGGSGGGGWVGGSQVWGVRVDVNEELKFFLENSQKKIRGEGGRREGRGSGGGSGWWGVRVDVNAMLGVGG